MVETIWEVSYIAWNRGIWESMQRITWPAVFIFCLLAACGQPGGSPGASGSDPTLEGGVECAADDLIATDINELDWHFDFPDDPDTSLTQYLNDSNQLDGMPREEFQQATGDSNSQEIGSDVSYTATVDGKKVAEVTITQVNKDSWGVVEFSACQSFIDKYRSMEDSK